MKCLVISVPKIIITEIIKDYQSGLSASEIARKYLISRSTIIKYLKKNNIPIIYKRIINKPTVEIINWTSKEQRNKEAIKLYQEGKGTRLVSRILNISRNMVYNILEKEGILTNKNRIAPRKTIDTKQIIERYQAGDSTEILSKEFNVSNGTIANRLRESNILLRPPGDTNSIIPVSLQQTVINWYIKNDLSTYDISNKLLKEYNLKAHPNSIQNFINRKGIMRHGKELKDHVARKQKNKQYRTKPERIVEQILIELNIKYDWQYVIDGWTFDFRFNNILIEVQGDHWHNLPKNKQKDAKKYKIAIKNGFEICYIWEHELYYRNKKYDLNPIKDRIKSYL